MRKYIKIFIGLGIIIIVGLMCYMVSRISELEYAQKNNTVSQITEDKSAIIKKYNRNLDISFDFKFNGFQNEEDKYQDLFQTSDGNEGIRLEFLNATQTGVWGIIFPLINGNEEVQSIPLNPIPTLHMWHKMNIKSNKNNIEIYVDGILQKKAVIDTQNFKVDNVAVDTGFSQTRPFNGQIKNFTLKTYKYSNIVSALYFCLSQLIILLFIGIFPCFRGISLHNIFTEISKVKCKIYFYRIFPSIITFIMIFRNTNHYIFKIDK